MKYLPLYKAILKDDLKSVERFCISDASAFDARITVNFDTALHVAVATGNACGIVGYLLNNMSPDQVLSLKIQDGNTVLSIAAIVGNVKAAEMIVKKQPELNNIANNCGCIPLVLAAQHGRKKMTKYLLKFNENYLLSDSTNVTGTSFVNSLIIAGFYDLALELVKQHQCFATTELNGGESLLSAIARKTLAFPSGKLDLWHRDIFRLLKIFIKYIKSQLPRPFHKTLFELVKLLCEEITTNLDHERASSILKRPFLIAIELGVHEVVEEILKSFPDAVWFSDEMNRNAFQLSVMNRREKVFSVIFQMSGGHKYLLSVSKDKFGNNILHLAGKKAPQNQLNLICGAALQMQRELQWFQEVEKIVQPDYIEEKNFDKKTPAMVFTEEHKELIEKGEKWMKDAAISYSIAAALIATVVFAAAITVPGGNKDDGQPNFYRQKTFGIFGSADAVSLFTSMASILMFLSTLTARYAEYDFLYILPMRFISGLLLLLLSIASMMITFVMTLYLVFSDRKAGIFYLVLLYAVILAYLFTYTQVPLLVEMIISTLGGRIYRKQRVPLKLISLF